MDIDLAALKELDHQVQAFINEKSNIVFCNLKPEGLITSSSDILMKYGVFVEGTWSIVGIKDANPDGDVQAIMKRVENLKKIHETMNFVAHNVDLLTRVRFWLGRPNYCYGITPLAIFREIGG